MNTQREMFEKWWQQNRPCDDEDYHPAMRHYAWEAWQAAIAAQQVKPVKLQHLAVCDEGVLRWMSGITPRDCELYAMPDGGNAPNVVYIIPTDAMEKQNGSF